MTDDYNPGANPGIVIYDSEAKTIIGIDSAGLERLRVMARARHPGLIEEVPALLDIIEQLIQDRDEWKDAYEGMNRRFPGGTG